MKMQPAQIFNTTVSAADNFAVGDLITVDFGTTPDAAEAEITKMTIFRFE
jgi:hypothetical protein